MSYCNNCGSKIPDGTKFCSNCGADSGVTDQPAQAQPQQAYTAPQQYSGPYQQPAHVQPIKGAHLARKTPILGLILSWFVLMGSGQMYAGKVGRGFAFMGGLMATGVIMGILIFVTFDPFIALYALPVIFGIQIWCVVDAYKQVQNYNRFIDTHGRAPTSGDNW